MGDSNDDDDNVDKNARNLFMMLPLLAFDEVLGNRCFDILHASGLFSGLKSSFKDELFED